MHWDIENDAGTEILMHFPLAGLGGEEQRLKQAQGHGKGDFSHQTVAISWHCFPEVETSDGKALWEVIEKV